MVRANESERVRRKRAQIRTGAVEVFLASGFVGSSMDQVASTAQVSKQTLYSYYRSKEELLVDVMSTLLDGLQEKVPDLWDRKVSTREQLRANLVDVAVSLTSVIMREDYLALVRVILGELYAVPELAALWSRTMPAQLIERVQGVLRRGQQAGVVRDVDLELATRMFVGPVMSYVLLDGVARPGNVVVPPPSRLEEMVDLYLGIVT